MTKPTAKYLVAFVNDFDKKILAYTKKNQEKEIFIGLIGKVRGQGKGKIVFQVHNGVPFPNFATISSYYVQISDNWLEIIREYFNFHYSSIKAVRILGVLHTHPSSIPALSSEDRSFAIKLAENAGNAIMLVVGKKNVMYSYLVFKEDVLKIAHSSKSFGKKYKQLT